MRSAASWAASAMSSVLTPAREIIELQARLHAIGSSSRPSHAAHGRYTSRPRAAHAADSRQADAATICQQTCRMLESYAVVSMCRSAEVSGRALALIDAYRRSTHGAWRPEDEVRPTCHRPCRFAAPIWQDLLSALDGGTIHARTLYAILTGP